MRLIKQFGILLRFFLTTIVKIFCAFCGCFFFVATCNAATYESANTPKIKQLALSNTWMALIHFRNGISGELRSEISHTRFFASPQGETDPVAELKATLALFQTHPQSKCRFPARYHWLKTHFELSDSSVSCEELLKWQRTINPKSVTLVFPAAYLNSPSSMFGHTLLRINPDDHRKDLPLAAYALNYAANVAADDNGFMFAIKGIFGGYPGSIAIVPYHEKIDEYSYIENRDIWEYPLNLNQEETKQLLRHAWELKDLEIPYYFFDQNCSYFLLTLIQVARPNTLLSHEFTYKALPVDTVRALEDAGFITQANYRPSRVSNIKQRMHSSSKQQISVARKIVMEKQLDKNTLQALGSDSSKAKTLELAYDTIQYQAVKSKKSLQDVAAFNYQLLSTRSTLNVTDIWPATKPPMARPEQGHGSARSAMSWLRRNKQNILQWKIRPAYHDILDPMAGYEQGAQINFFEMSVEYHEPSSETYISQLTFLDLLSLSQRDQLFQPWSWGVNLAYHRLALENNTARTLQVQPAIGVSYGDMNKILLYSLMHLDIRAGRQLSQEHALGLGPSIGLVHNHGTLAGQLKIKGLRYISGEEHTRINAQMSLAYHLGIALSVRAEINRQLFYKMYQTEAGVSIQWYF